MRLFHAPMPDLGARSNVHFSSADNTWETPQTVFDALDAEFGFDLDACATPETAKCGRYFSEGDDALLQEWWGVVFCNPPYGRHIGRWMRKAYLSALGGATVVCLVPSRTDTRWWHEYAMGGRDSLFARKAEVWRGKEQRAVSLCRGGVSGRSLGQSGRSGIMRGVGGPEKGSVPVSEPDLAQLRRAVERLLDGQQEALEAIQAALEGGEGLTEETLVDLEDILQGASEDARSILGTDEEGAE